MVGFVGVFGRASQRVPVGVYAHRPIRKGADSVRRASAVQVSYVAVFPVGFRMGRELKHSHLRRRWGWSVAPARRTPAGYPALLAPVSPADQD